MALIIDSGPLCRGELRAVARPIAILLVVLALAACDPRAVKMGGGGVGHELFTVDCEREAEACRAAREAVELALSRPVGRINAYARPEDRARSPEGRDMALLLPDIENSSAVGLTCWSSESAADRCEVTR